MPTTSATSSSSATSQLISSLGGGSGIDMSALAEQLAAAQYAARLDAITARTEKLTTQISSASTLKGMVSSLASSLGDRVRTGDLAVTPEIANSAVAVVSKGASTGRGTATLEVTALAKAQTLVSPTMASETATIGAGTLTLRFGTISGGALTADTGRDAVAISVPQGATLDTVASAINAAAPGVNAYVAAGPNGAQLVLKGQDGAANAFVLEAAEDPADPGPYDTGLAALAWTPSGDAKRLTAAASDAAYTLDGIKRTAASNTITDAMPGLSLKLTGTNAGAPTTIGFSDPSSAITTAMSDLTSALNEMVAELNRDSDPTTGTLGNDPGTRTLRRSLATLASTAIMPASANGAPTTLSELGLATNRDGTFTFDANRLAATLKRDPAGTAAMFTNGVYGVFASFDKLSRSVGSTTDAGSIGGSITRLTKLQTTLATQRTDLTTKQEDLRVKLVSRYAKLNTNITNSKSTLSFLKAQQSAQNGSSG
jgi:flagellar hook-associated protein 2